MVFAVKGRTILIPERHEEELYKYITGIVKHKKQKLIAINGMPDHVHIFVGLKTDMAVSDLVRDVKHFSTDFINGKKWLRGKFYWQEGFGAFSYSRSQISAVVNYIMNQKTHHRKKSFREEYIAMLKRFEIEYDDKYLFDWIE